MPNKDSSCPCGSGRPLATCCGPVLAGTAPAKTAEALMRSRYAAHVLGDIDYLRESLWPPLQKRFDAVGTRLFAEQTQWTGLAILESEGGGENDRRGIVLFEARYLDGGALRCHRERGLFRRKADRWYYVEATES